MRGLDPYVTAIADEAAQDRAATARKAAACQACGRFFASPAALEAHWRYRQGRRVCGNPGDRFWHMDTNSAGAWFVPEFLPHFEERIPNNWFRDQSLKESEFADWAYKPTKQPGEQKNDKQ